MASGVEPHYHDNDEFWFWATGRGEVWLDGTNIPVGSNTVTYTPMGAVYKFLMHTDFEVVAVITRPERRKRMKHVLVEEDGPPDPTPRESQISSSVGEVVPRYAAGSAINLS